VSGYGKITRYDATSTADYQVVRDMVKALGLRKEEMLR
jgi:phosphonate transport system substrate-binding protein